MKSMTCSSMNLQLILLIIIILSAAQINSSPDPECQTSCGNVTIPFPFGTTSECCLADSFLITCNYSYNPPKPFLNLSSAEVLDISIDGLLRIASSVASDCYDSTGSQINATISELSSSKFPISSTRNKFTAVGCDTYALVEGSEEWKHMSAGCVSWCDNIDSVVNGTCSGIGCCQTLIPRGVKDFLVDIRSFRNHTRVNGLNPCGYAFVVESEAFEFSSSDLWDLQERNTVPVVLDWSVGNVTCLEARNMSNYACRASHSECSDSSNGLGYNCQCSTGFQGNPYLDDGCQDIDECTPSNPCEGTCANLNGSYSCSCPEGFEGDGKTNGSGCHQLKSQIKGSMLFYITSGFMIPAVGSSWIFWRRKQKKLVKLRRDLFRKNGGPILQEMLGRHGRLVIFTAEELKMATNNYNDNNIIHRDHHSVGIEYKGEVPIRRVNQLVTIKRCDEIDQCEITAYIQKLVTFSLALHRNVVRLIGCCLETQVPLLVYEFITDKTLYDYIHEDLAAFNSWDILLKIAAGTARALAYMHSADKPVIHGNLNSSNILIDNDQIAKVQGFSFRDCCDFSKTFEPEYFSLGALTTKGDVYSFGIVLAELLMGKNVFENPGGPHFTQYFVSSSTRDEWIRILDPRLANNGNIEQLTQVVKLGQRCLSVFPVERPTMKEAAMELESAIITNSSSIATRSNSRLRTTVRRLLRRNMSL